MYRPYDPGVCRLLLALVDKNSTYLVQKLTCMPRTCRNHLEYEHRLSRSSTRFHWRIELCSRTTAITCGIHVRDPNVEKAIVNLGSVKYPECNEGGWGYIGTSIIAWRTVMGGYIRKSNIRLLHDSTITLFLGFPFTRTPPSLTPHDS